MSTDAEPGATSGWRVPPGILVQELPEDELMFLDSRTDAFFALDRHGARLYRALLAAGDPAETADALGRELGLPSERVHADLRQLADRLVERGLLEPVA